MNYLDPNQADWALQDPNTPGEVLAAIAQAHPGLRDRVVTHPNAYPQLVTWIAARSTSAAGAPEPSQSAGQPSGPLASPPYSPAQPQDLAQPYGPAQPQGLAQPYSPAQPQGLAQPYSPAQSYGSAQPYGSTPQPSGPAQPYPTVPSGPGQPYVPGGYQAPPAKKKTGLILGLVGGGVVVVGVVAVLGLFVFHWFGGSSGSGPTLTTSQAESFLDSDFMQKVSDGTNADDYYHSSLSASDLEEEDYPSSCQDVVDIQIDADSWYSSTASVLRYAKQVSPDSLIDATTRCDRFEVSAEDLDDVSIHEQGGGWRVAPGNGGATFIYGNVWLNLSDDMNDDEAKDLFKDFASAVDAAAKS